MVSEKKYRKKGRKRPKDGGEYFHQMAAMMLTLSESSVSSLIVMWCVLFEEEIWSVSSLANQLLRLMSKELKGVVGWTSLLSVHCLLSCLFVQAQLPWT